MMPGNALAVEIWNGIWEDRNEEALRLFYTWLNRDIRIVATSGTDIHRRPPPNFPGRGAVNVVYADDLTESDIIAGIKAGRSYVSAGPTLEVSAQSKSGEEAMLGDALPDEPTVVKVRWQDAPEKARLR